MLTLLVVKGPDRGRVYRWPSRHRLILGRHGRYFRLTDGKLSRLHCELAWHDGAWHVRDLNSRNGTSLNGAKLTNPVALQDGDQIKLGFTVLAFCGAVREPEPVEQFGPGSISPEQPPAKRAEASAAAAESGSAEAATLEPTAAGTAEPAPEPEPPVQKPAAVTAEPAPVVVEPEVIEVDVSAKTAEPDPIEDEDEDEVIAPQAAADGPRPAANEATWIMGEHGSAPALESQSQSQTGAEPATVAKPEAEDGHRAVPRLGAELEADDEMSLDLDDWEAIQSSEQPPAMALAEAESADAPDQPAEPAASASAVTGEADHADARADANLSAEAAQAEKSDELGKADDSTARRYSIFAKRKPIVVEPELIELDLEHDVAEAAADAAEPQPTPPPPPAPDVAAPSVENAPPADALAELEAASSAAADRDEPDPLAALLASAVEGADPAPDVDADADAETAPAPADVAADESADDDREKPFDDWMSAVNEQLNRSLDDGLDSADLDLEAQPQTTAPKPKR